MQALHLVGTIVYFVVLVCLSCYGIHRYWMIFLYFRHRREVPQPAGHFAELPKVTVQLPLYNEMYVAERLLEIREKYGPDPIGFLVSAKCTNEENYLMQKVARGLIGTNNVDHCARL